VESGTPPNACTIWITCSEPLPGYSFPIRGETVGGTRPDLALYDALRRTRQRPKVLESFTGRITAPARDGKTLELGTGDLSLPPEGEPGAAGAWGQPQAAAWGPPQGIPPAYGGQWGGAYGGPPPWMPPGPWGPWGPPGWGGAGAWGGAAAQQPPAWALPILQSLQQQPPPNIASDPRALELWKAMQQANQPMQDLTTRLITGLMEKATPAAAVPAADPVDTITKYAKLINELRGPQAAASEGGPVQVTMVPDGAGGQLPLITSNGKVDNNTMLGIAAVGAARNIGGIVKTRFAGKAVSEGVAGVSAATMTPKGKTNGSPAPAAGGTK
jgi:hypothetical protein